MDIELAQALEENAEQKEIVTGYKRTMQRLRDLGLPTFMSVKETICKLTEAKEIIRDFLNRSDKTAERAEKFLKECEK